MKQCVVSMLYRALLLIGFALSSNIHAQEVNWQLEIELSKTTYTAYEPIWLDATLTNVTSDSLRTHGIVAPYHFQFFIEITDSSGDVLEYHGPMWSSVSGPGAILLESGEQEYECFDLLEFYRVLDGSSDFPVQSWYFPFIPTGSYSVQTHFEGVKSNVLSFTITEPKGEEKEALEHIAEASSLWRQDNSDPSGRKFQEFVDRFPNSVLAAKCLRQARMYSDNAIYGYFEGGTTFDRIGLMKELLERFPNSGSTGGWLKIITYGLEQSEKEMVLNQVLEDHPNTRSSRFAKQLRKRILDKKGGE